MRNRLPWMAGLALLASACIPYRMYEGGEWRPPDEYAVVERGPGIVLLSIDARDTGIRRTFHLEPGPHRLEVQVERTRPVRGDYGGDLLLPGVCLLEATTEGGRRYVVEAQRDDANDDAAWTAWLRDRAADANVGTCSSP